MRGGEKAIFQTYIRNMPALKIAEIRVMMTTRTHGQSVSKTKEQHYGGGISHYRRRAVSFSHHHAQQG